MTHQARDIYYARILSDAIRAADAVDARRIVAQAQARVESAPSIGDLVDTQPVYRAQARVESAPGIGG